MVAHARNRYVTPEEYLRREHESETKSEYVDGVIVAMSGASWQHDAIAASISGEVYHHLRPAGCRGYTSNMRVRITAANRYYYPDYAIVCGQPRIEVLLGVDSLVNPSVIFEILSASTERVDRVEKWQAYQQIASITTYILIHQDKPQVEIYYRTSEAAEWEFTEVTGLESSFHLAPIGRDITLAQIYADVEFGAADEPEGRR